MEKKDTDTTYPWPQKGSQLFIQDGSDIEIAYIGWFYKTDFHGYIDGYKKAGDYLIKTILDSGKNYERDTIVFPILFLYRQYLELERKR